MLELRGTPGPVIAVAVHDGHHVRPEVAAWLAVPEAERRFEEDPHTGRLTAIGDLGVVARTSRFEYDLNRSRDACVYPASVWGIDVWRDGGPPEDVAEGSRRRWDHDDAVLAALCEAALVEVEEVLVLDLHSYNIRGRGEDDPALPLLDVGTNRIDRARWAAPVEAFLGALGRASFRGAPVTVAENTPFGGGDLARRLTERHGDRLLVLSVELRKSFMDERTGVVDDDALGRLHQAVEDAAAAARGAMRA